MAFVIQEDYVFVNEYLDDDDNDLIINNEIILLDNLIQQTVINFFHNKNISEIFPSNLLNVISQKN